MCGLNTVNVEEEPKHTLGKLERQIIALLKNGALTRDQLVEQLGIPRTTIYDSIRRLILWNIVTKYPLDTTERSRGRPRILFSLIDEYEE